MADDNDRRYDERREAAGPHARVGNVDHAYWQEQMEMDRQTGSFMEYAGYRIPEPNADGKVIVTKNGTNPMPGATWFTTQVDAKAGVDILEAVGRDGKRFWHLMGALQWARGEL